MPSAVLPSRGLWWFAGLAFALASGCDPALGANDDVSAIPVTPEVVVGGDTSFVLSPGCEVPADIATLIQTKCGPGCHTGGAGQGGVKLDAETVLESQWIVPGDPANSVIVQSVSAGRMPLGGSLSGAETEALKAWISGLDCQPPTVEEGAAGVAAGLAPGCSLFQTVDCNPISNGGCSASRGEACDLYKGFRLFCQPAPNVVPPLGACDNLAGPFCVGGHRCSDDGRCRPFCCGASDCVGGLSCQAIDPATGTLGVCR